LGPQQESTQHGLSQQTPLQQLSKPGQQESPQHGWSQHSSPQQWKSQQVSPQQPLAAGGSQTVAPHWVTGSAQTPSKQLPEQQSLSALHPQPSTVAHRWPQQTMQVVPNCPQSTHASPPEPQCWSPPSPGWQEPVSSQQPPPQVSALQAQTWLTQGVPAGHTAHWRPSEPQVWGVLPG
jgi:hypothetical protein